MANLFFRRATACIMALTLPVAGAQVAHANPAEPAVVQEDLALYRVSDAELDALNQLRAEDGLSSLPDSVEVIYLDDDLRVQAIDAAGNPVLIEDDAVKADDVATFRDSEYFINLAADIVFGCVGGVVGYNTIVDLLEGRAGKWALVKFLAKKVGWGMAIGCVGGSVSRVMGWE